MKYNNGMDNAKQIEFINHDVCDMSLKGIPGGGKTKSIIDKVIHLNQIRFIIKNNWPNDFATA